MTATQTNPSGASAPQGPLAGLKVLELGQLIAGPFAAKTLADFGADVIKIESPGAGDPLRKWRLLKDGTSVWWQVQSRNKRSVALDLKSPQAQDIVRRLAAESDVLIENFRPGAMEGWGLGPDDLLGPDGQFAPGQLLRPRAFRSFGRRSRASVSLLGRHEGYFDRVSRKAQVKI